MSRSSRSHIEVEFNHNRTRQDFQAVEQSIWTTGEGFTFSMHAFLGPNIPFDESVTLFPSLILPLPVPASASGHFKVGLQVDIDFNGGAINATLPYEITIDTTYNATTDSLLIQTGAALAPGAIFSTTGPEGAVNFQFIIDMLATLALEDGVAGVVGVSETFAFQEATDPFSFDSQGPDVPHRINLPGGFSIDLDWPHLSGGSTGQSGSQVTGEASSNNILQLNLDVDAAAALYFQLFAPIEALLDPDPLSETNSIRLERNVRQRPSLPKLHSSHARQTVWDASTCENVMRRIATPT